MAPNFFLPASSKSNNRPSVPWEHRGGRARWERGIHVTTAQHKRPAGGKGKRTGRGQKEGEEEEEESAFERCFQLLEQGPSLCGDDKERKSTTADAKDEWGANPAMSFIRLGG